MTAHAPTGGAPGSCYRASVRIFCVSRSFDKHGAAMIVRRYHNGSVAMLALRKPGHQLKTGKRTSAHSSNLRCLGACRLGYLKWRPLAFQ